MSMDVKHCRGCEDDFYNDHNPMGVKKCWHRADAKLVIRYRTGTWTLPTSKWAYAEVEVPNCYHQRGEHFSERLPDFVKVEVVLRARKAVPPVRLSEEEREVAAAMKTLGNLSVGVGIKGGKG